jgi:hypothetical protein
MTDAVKERIMQGTMPVLHGERRHVVHEQGHLLLESRVCDRALISSFLNCITSIFEIINLNIKSTNVHLTTQPDYMAAKQLHRVGAISWSASSLGSGRACSRKS